MSESVVFNEVDGKMKDTDLKISVAVCTYRRFELLGDCLELIRKQTLPSNQYEIIVVDNSLQPEESRAFRDSLKGFDNLNYIITEKCGIAFARNVALEHCKAPILLFTDDDVRVPSTWCSDYLKVFENYPAAGVIGGRVDPIWPTPPPSWLSGQLLEPLAVLNWDEEEVVPINERRWLVTANAAYLVKALRKGGGFCERLGRKGKLPFWHAELGANLAVKGLGYNILYAPHIQVGHMIEPQRMQKEWFYRQQLFGGASMVAVKWQKEYEIDFETLATTLETTYKRLLEQEKSGDTVEDVIRVANIFHEHGYRICLEHLGIEATLSPPPRSNVWPVIYIITLCKNAVATIDQTILSVLNQEGDFCIRYHIRDTGSDDGTLDRLEHWKQILNDGSFPFSCKNIVFTYTTGHHHGILDEIVNGFAEMSIPNMAFMTWTEGDDIIFPTAFNQLMAVNRQFPERDLWLNWEISIGEGKRNSLLIHGGILPKEIISDGSCEEKNGDSGRYKGVFFRKKLLDKMQADGILDDFDCAGMVNDDIRRALIQKMRHYSTIARRLASIASEYETIAAERNKLRAELKAIAAERDVLRAGLDALAAEKDVSSAIKSLASFSSECSSLAAERDALRAERNELKHYSDQLQNSLSWRITSPLRVLGRRFMQKRSKEE